MPGLKRSYRPRNGGIFKKAKYTRGGSQAGGYGFRHLIKYAAVPAAAYGASRLYSAYKKWRSPKRPLIPRSTYLGLGFPEKIKGVLKSTTAIKAIDTPTSQFHFALLHLCDMNNDLRTASAAADEGTSHLITAVTPTLTQLRAPYYFDDIAVHFVNYLIKKISWKMVILNNEAAASDDITVAWKLLRSHEDTNSNLKQQASVEVLKSTAGMRTRRINPTVATRTGRPSSTTIYGSYLIHKIVPKRVYFAEATEAGVGEKTFASTAAITDGAGFHASPRVVFWAWNTFDQSHISADALSVVLEVRYHYTAFNSKVAEAS